MSEDKIIQALETKASLKQQIYRSTLEVFKGFQEEIVQTAATVANQMAVKDASVEIKSRNISQFESELTFSGDTLVFLMHTNVFTFPEDHFVSKSKYVAEDESRAYCGMILIYNFLTDSLKYNRLNDLGNLIGRVFVNKDLHFFTGGHRQFAFLHRDFDNETINRDNTKNIIETAILHAIDFDLYVPPFDAMRELNVNQKIQLSGNAAIKTGKRLGFASPNSDD